MMKHEDFSSFKKVAKEILCHKHVLQMRCYIQHGSVTCLEHSFVVAYYSYSFMKKMRLHCDDRSLIRGALLHDYFLYDWHDNEKWHRLHGFKHPRFALHNALRDFQINDLEAEIIKKHMWPLTILPPTKKEAWIVTMVDKISSLIEIVMEIHMLHGIRKRWFVNKINILKELLEESI